jgi:hypothetical protein
MRRNESIGKKWKDQNCHEDDAEKVGDDEDDEEAEEFDRDAAPADKLGLYSTVVTNLSARR